MTQITRITLAIVLLAFASIGRAQSPATQTADALFQAHKWSDAAKAYESVIQIDPNNGRAWYRLGFSLLSLSKYEQAATTLQKAVNIGNRPEPMYALAQAYARLGDKEKAFDWLNKSLSLKLPQANEIAREPNLTSLHDDPRFAKTTEEANKLTHPCFYQPEYKQFDYWVGEWTVAAEGQKIATSSIQRIVENCIVFENYLQADGYAGKSFNFYDSTLRKWRQTWVDGTGRVSEFLGEFKDGAMRFEGESHLSDGTRILRRMTLFNLNPTQVRQLSQLSRDDGRTWSVNYDFTYTRDK